jgi:Uma2 family endonuclease
MDGERPMSEAEYYEFCARNPDLRIEREITGDIIGMPPAGAETGYRNSDLAILTRNVGQEDGHGKAFDSNKGFSLPGGAAFAPNASWVLNSSLESFTKEQKQRILPLCPDLVVELTSLTDRLSRVKAKMHEWIDDGAQLGWLIDAGRRTVYVHRA